MTRIFTLLASAAYVMSFVFILSAVNVSPSHADEALSDAQKQEIRSLVESTLMDNPEIIVKAIEKYQRDQEEMAAREQDEKVKAFNEKLETMDNLVMVGNPDADVTVVEFFDYNCGYCKKAFDELQQLINEDDNIQVVFKEMPILGPSSYEAAKWALAAHKQDKYFEYHAALMDLQGPKNQANFKKIGKDIGLDVDQLEKDVKDPSIEQTIQENIQLSQDLGIRGTPAFLINDHVTRGYIPYARMKQIIAQKRKEANQNDG